MVLKMEKAAKGFWEYDFFVGKKSSILINRHKPPNRAIIGPLYLRREKTPGQFSC